MQTFKHILLAAALLPALALADDAQQTVKIGFSSPLTGAQASAGKDNLGGLQMAVERLNAEKMKIGGKQITFEILAEDDQADPRAGVTVAQKLVDSGAKAVVGPYNSGVTIPASRVYNDAGVVVATVSSNPKVTQQGYPYLFRIAANDVQLGGKMAAYAARELKVKRVAVIDDRTAYGQGLVEEFEKTAKKSNLKIVAREFTNDKATDFQAILTSIKGKKPDAIFYGGYAPQAGPMVRQMRQLGIKAYVLGGDGICSAEMGRLAGEFANEQVYCTQGGAMLEKLAEGKKFTADYKVRHNRAPEVYAPSFYDGMMLIAQAMKKANSVEPQKYLPVLNTIRYKGIAGVYEFDANRDLKQSPVTVFQFKAGEPVALTSY